MNSFFQTLAFTYLPYPILGLIPVGLGVFIAKKNALLGNKRLVGYTIGAIVILTIPALLGFLDYGFMPYGYVFLAMLYLLLGSYNIRLIAWVFKNDYKYRHEIILTSFGQQQEGLAVRFTVTNPPWAIDYLMSGIQ